VFRYVSDIFFWGIIRFMDPITAVTRTWTMAKTAGEISKKLYELGKSFKDRDQRQQIDEIVDRLRYLKQSASDLEDENRALRETLRFKSDEYEFRTPFYYDKAHPDRPLCPKCFSKKDTAPMGEPGHGCDPAYRRCLVCGECIEVTKVSRYRWPDPDY